MDISNINGISTGDIKSFFNNTSSLEKQKKKQLNVQSRPLVQML